MEANGWRLEEGGEPEHRDSANVASRTPPATEKVAAAMAAGEAATPGRLGCGAAGGDVVAEGIDPPRGVVGPSVTTAVAAVDTAETDDLTPLRRRRFSEDAQGSHVRWGHPVRVCVRPAIAPAAWKRGGCTNSGGRDSTILCEQRGRPPLRRLICLLEISTLAREPRKGEQFSGKVSSQMGRRRHTVAIQTRQ